MERTWQLTASTRTDSRLEDLTEKASGGDGKALEALKSVLSTKEWDGVGDLAQQALYQAAQAVAQNPLVTAAVMDKALALRRELAEVDATPLEKLLVNRIIVCWVHAYDADLRQSYALQDGSLEPGAAAYLVKLQESAHRRLLAAVKTLAAVRRLLRPGIVQVNVQTAPGAQQANILVIEAPE